MKSMRAAFTSVLFVAGCFSVATRAQTIAPSSTLAIQASTAPTAAPLTAEDLALVLEIQTNQANIDYAKSQNWDCNSNDMDVIRETLTNILFGKLVRRLGQQNRKLCRNKCAGWPPSNLSLCISIYCRRREEEEEEAALEQIQYNVLRSLTGDKIPEYLRDDCNAMKSILFQKFQESELPDISQECRDSLVFTSTLEHLYQANLVIYCFV